MDVENIFRKYHLNNGESELVNFGNLSVRIKREGQVWIINSFDKHEEEPAGGEYYQTGISDQLILAPALQSKPLVFKGNGMSVMPGQKFTFFVKIPLIIQIFHTKKQNENLIKELTHTRLSDTWFGEPDNGEAAYSLDSEFKLNLNEMVAQPYEAICPIQVFNNWDSILELQRLILRVENISLFQVKDSIFTSLVKIEYKGKDSISSADYKTSKIYHGENPQIIARPRNTGSSPLKINFHFIRNIYRNM